MKVDAHIVQKVIKKAIQSNCCYKVAAIGISKKGEVLYSATNRHRFPRKFGGTHAEMAVMKSCPKSLKTIVICRVGKGGDLLPISPCKMCSEKAQELNVKIISIGN